MSKIDENQMIKETYICPEIVCDAVKQQLGRLGIAISDNTYASIWDDVDRRNDFYDVSPMNEEEKYAERRRLNLIKG